jgi:hypothetical protein
MTVPAAVLAAAVAAWDAEMLSARRSHTYIADARNAAIEAAYLAGRADAAWLIRDELVCCDIHQRLEDALDAAGGVTAAYREIHRSHDYHAICHFGEWSARLAEREVAP